MILIVDDDELIRMSLGLLMKRAGYPSESAATPEEAMSLVRTRNYDLIIMDMNYSRATTGEEGIALLRKVRIFQPETPVILITAWGSIDLAVEGMRHGAFDFITKPWNNLLLLKRIETALKLNSHEEETGDSKFNRCGIIGNNKAVTELLDTVERIAPTDAPVLILGENGTGKEMIANAIHANSRRSKENFVMVNLGGISQSLFESEMFGHKKGAFTGAVADRKGRFELADKGTVFLDEIGDLDLACQVKLLRVLQQHTFEPLGSSDTKSVDIRVVCATNADLPTMIHDKRFREDLFYRINLITLHLPALRERRDDIPLLVRHFIQQSSAANSLALPEISQDAMEYLCRLPYSGNIRQLKNMVERAVLVGGSRLEKDLFSSQPGVEEMPAATGGAKGTLEEIEYNAIVDALAQTDSNLVQAARMLGITRQSLYRRMEKYGLK